MKSIILFLGTVILLCGCGGERTKPVAEKANTAGLPVFKYNPNAVRLGIISEEKIKCSVCGQQKDFAYKGPFYSAERNVGKICPWCIKNGAAAKKYHGTFHDRTSVEKTIKPAYVEELTTRTPGYTGLQQEQWLSHCGDFCAFQEYVGWTDIIELKEELSGDIARIRHDNGMKEDDLEKHLVRNGSMQGYLFQCLHCGKHRLTIDTN